MISPDLLSTWDVRSASVKSGIINALDLDQAYVPSIALQISGEVFGKETGFGSEN